MKKINEEVNFKYRNFKTIDPFGEEDWDEFELTNNTILYFFGIKDNKDIIYGVGKVKISNDIVFPESCMYIQKCSDNSLNKKTININNINESLTSKQFSISDLDVGDGVLLTTFVVDFRFNQYYKNIHENVRKSIYNTIKNSNNKIRNIEAKLDEYEEIAIQLKKNIKSKNEFPEPKDLHLKDDEFVVIRSTKRGEETTVDIIVTKISDEDDKGGRNLLDDSGNKVTYIKNKYDKLISSKYLLLKNGDGTKHTYITSDLEIYLSAVDRIINIVNTDIEKSIDENREKYKVELQKIKKYREELDIARENYQNFSFSKLVDDFKTMVGK